MAAHSGTTTAQYTGTGTGLAAVSPVVDTVGFNHRNGFDLIWRQKYLQEQMEGIEAEIAAIEKNANLSDTERMFAMQMAMNTWSAISNLRTNMLKSVSDSLKTVIRNVV